MVALLRMRASKSARRIRTRLPTCSAGSLPESIQFRMVCGFSFKIAATSATVMSSPASIMEQSYRAMLYDPTVPSR